MVEASTELARQLHADDFQLLSPASAALAAEQYFGGVASGAFDHRVWDSELIAVRLLGQAVLSRFHSQLDLVVRGKEVLLRRKVNRRSQGLQATPQVPHS